MTAIDRRAATEQVKIVQVSGDPANVASQVLVYSKAVSGVSQLFAISSDGTVTQLTPDQGGGRELVNEQWMFANLAANQTSIALSAQVSQNFDTWAAIRAGSIVGMRTRLDTPVTAGTLTVKVTKGGVDGTLSVVSTNASNASGGASTQAVGTDTFVAGDLLAFSYTTTAGFTPAGSAKLEAYMEIDVS